MSTGKSKVGLAVPDMSLATLPGQYKLSVTGDRQWVKHEIAGWSVGFRWLTFEYENTPHQPVSPLFRAGLDEDYLASVEQRVFEDWMVAYHRRHRQMHNAALRHGLSAGGG